MFVIKRDKTKEEVNFNKVYTRIKHLVSKPYQLNDEIGRAHV